MGPQKFQSNPKVRFDKREGALTIMLTEEHLRALIRGGTVEYATLSPREVNRVIMIRESQ